MADEHLYVVTYDISDDRRWRAVFKLMHGYGEWMQLSVFQCRLVRARYVELIQKLEALISSTEDAVMIVDIGRADIVVPRVHCMGKRGFAPIERAPVIV